MYRIDFTNEKDDKLTFYEKFDGTSKTSKRLEFAYITPTDPDIVTIDEHGDIKRWPKDQIVEYILNLYGKITEEVFGQSVSLKAKSSQPRYGLRIQGKEINLIHFFVANMGLLQTLDYFDIKYQLSRIKAIGAFYHLRVQDQKYNYLSVFANSKHEEYLINGLKDGAKMIFPTEVDKLRSNELYDDFLKLKGNSYPKALRNLKDIFIDQTTAKILKMYNMPSDIFELFGKFIPKFLINNKTEDFTDLSTQRIRMAESVSHSAYKMLQKAIMGVKNIKKTGNDHDLKLALFPYEIIKELQASGMLQSTQTTNPLEELMLSTKITKTGVGNPLAQQIVLKNRDLNPSYYGVVSPVSTNEYSNVGSTQTLANKATITNRFGSILLKKFTNDVNSFDLLSANESLQPFYEYDDTTRRVMGNQQFGQFVPIDHPDEPLVQTGFESIIPHLVSDRFAIKAKKEGRVVKITKEDIIVTNKDGTQTKYNIREGTSKTKRGIFIPLKYNINVKEGQKIRIGEILAATNSLKNNTLAAGRNLVVAEMSYRGMNYEDGWVITDSVKEKYINKTWERITIIVPTGAKILSYNIAEGNVTNSGDILLTITNTDDNLMNFVNDEEENSSDVLVGVEFFGSQIKYRSTGGEIKKVIIKINNKNIDGTILKEWKKSVDKIESRQDECKLLKHNQEEYVDCISGIENTEIVKVGGHKINSKEFDGAVIELYLEKDNIIGNGSKFTLAATGGKGTIQYIIPPKSQNGDELAPVALDSKLKIEFIPTPLSIIGRKNLSILLLMYSGKVIYFLNIKLQQLIRAGKIHEAKTLLYQVITSMDESEDHFLTKEIMGFFDSQSPQDLLKYINSRDPLARPAFPLLVPPHKNKITIRHIEEAAQILGIKLNEKVYIPEEDTITEKEVPVGIMPVIYLEHFPKAMSSVRGSINAKRQFTSGQGRSGTRQGSGAIKLGEYELFAMSFKEPGLLMKELHGVHSDNKKAQEKFLREILKTGKMPTIADLPIETSESKTRKLVETFFLGAMLEPNF